MRHVDGTGATDTGEYSAIDFTRYVFFLLLRKCTEERVHAGKHGDRWRIHGRNQDVVFVFLLYTPVSTISLILVRSGERERVCV